MADGALATPADAHGAPPPILGPASDVFPCSQTFGGIHDLTRSGRNGVEIRAAAALAAPVFLILPPCRVSAHIGAMPAPPDGRRGDKRLSAAGASAD